MSKKGKIALAICVPILVVAIVLAVFFSVVFQSEKIRTTDVGTVNGNYATVLGNIEGIVEANPRIVDIAMLGSHGASSYAIVAGGEINKQDRTEVLRSFYPLIDGLFYRYVKAQLADVYTQLKQGARYLQIKYSYIDGEWWGCHSIKSAKLEEILLDILRFLQETKGEVVLPLFEPEDIGTASLAQFHEYIRSVKLNGTSLEDYAYYGVANTFNVLLSGGIDPEEYGIGRSIGTLRYNDITQNGTVSGVVLLEDRPDVYDLTNWGWERDSKYYDIDSNAYHPWHYRCNSDVLLDCIQQSADYLEENFDEYEYMLRINQSQGSFSQNIADWGHVVSEWSLIDFANKHNVRVLDDPNFFEWLEVMPIVHFDYITCANSDFNNRANQKIIEYNTRLVQNSIAA